MPSRERGLSCWMRSPRCGLNACNAAAERHRRRQRALTFPAPSRRGANSLPTRQTGRRNPSTRRPSAPPAGRRGRAVIRRAAARAAWAVPGVSSASFVSWWLIETARRLCHSRGGGPLQSAGSITYPDSTQPVKRRRAEISIAYLESTDLMSMPASAAFVVWVLPCDFLVEPALDVSVEGKACFNLPESMVVRTGWPSSRNIV